ncbi:hypothetical protein XELAEV_18038352mg [Xenopus laevis]|uniref:Uncharacterized protein n=1 Tax=Xenopus laevis TaxID=8355 RepID=A0A974C6R1_XENLA|nr:hypothetical protein XELAEV_18038352mg [Xenopus laevis]
MPISGLSVTASLPVSGLSVTASLPVSGPSVMASLPVTGLLVTTTTHSKSGISVFTPLLLVPKHPLVIWKVRYQSSPLFKIDGLVVTTTYTKSGTSVKTPLSVTAFVLVNGLSVTAFLAVHGLPVTACLAVLAALLPINGLTANHLIGGISVTASLPISGLSVTSTVLNEEQVVFYESKHVIGGYGLEDLEQYVCIILYNRLKHYISPGYVNKI